MTVVEFSPFAAGTDANPYPTYARMREVHPIYHHSDYGFYALSRFDDLQAVSGDWQRFSSAEGIDTDHTGDAFGPNFLHSDPPRHDLVRRSVQHRFAAAAVGRGLEPVVQEHAARLVGHIAGRRCVDIARDFAWPLSFLVACELLDLPLEDREFLWDAVRRFEEREVGQLLAPSSAETAAKELRDYMAARLSERRLNPGDDILSLLASTEVDGDLLPDAEVVGNAFLLLDAATITTGCLLTSATVLLDSHPDQRQWLAANPDQIPTAVEELLRFESPLQHLCRTATDDIERSGVRIPSGAMVVLLYGAANRDPEVWADPDRLDLARKPKRNIAFGGGIHHCLGAAVARLEARVALEQLLPHFETLRLTGPPLRLRSHALRGYVSVPADLA
jgi:cytochrome P450